MHGLEQAYYGRISFAYLDIDDPNTAQFKEQLGFRYQPQFFLVDGDGNVVEQWVGEVPENVFTTAFDSFLATTP